MFKITLIFLVAAFSGAYLTEALRHKHGKNAVIADDVYFFQNVQTGLYLESPHYRGSLGSSMGKYNRNDSPHQMFKINGAAQGTTLQPIQTEYDAILENNPDFTFNGNPVVTLWHNNPSINNTWNFPYCTVDTFFIESNRDKFVISDNGNSHEPYILTPRTGGARECWNIVNARNALSSINKKN